MLPFKKILCPTDFSEPSYEAIKAAGELAYHFGSELCIVHVITPVPILPMPMGPEPSAFNVSLYEQELEASSKRSLEEVVNQLESKELKTRLIALRGNPADEIVRTADEENVDLIVIATRGRTGLDRLIFGSVTEKVVRLAKCPVLTVTGGPSAEAGKEITLEKGGEVETPEEKSEKRKTYQEKVEAQLKEWSVKIDELKAKAERSKAELKMKYEKQIEDLRAQQEALKKNLQEFKESGEEAWEHLKTGIEKNFDELKDSADRTISLFKEKGEDVAETVSKKKKAYVEKVEDQLKDWGNQIDILKAKAEKSKAEIKIKYLEQVEELKSRQGALKQRLGELKESGDEAWEDFKDGLEDALDEMKKALKRGASRFKKS
jgi:nucleotide-binding universal stress UspA family protein/phage host-nuclease inhibitor protein Gam